MQCNQFELTVAIPRDGKSAKIREYGHNGLTMVEGRPGQVYSILFRNNSPFRVEAVFSVDGLSALDGKPATAASTGYVVEGYSTAEIKGWRTSQSTINQFFFENKAGSYAADSVSDTANCGVISCKVWNEKPKPIKINVPTVTEVIHEHHHHHHEPWWHTRPYYWGGSQITCCGLGGVRGSQGPTGTAGEITYSACASAPASESLIGSIQSTGATPEFNLGTGWGAQQTDCVAYVDFVREMEIASMDLYYSDSASLQKAGVILVKELAISSLPQGFGGFCQPPKHLGR